MYDSKQTLPLYRVSFDSNAIVAHGLYTDISVPLPWKLNLLTTPNEHTTSKQPEPPWQETPAVKHQKRLRAENRTKTMVSKLCGLWVRVLHFLPHVHHKPWATAVHQCSQPRVFNKRNDTPHYRILQLSPETAKLDHSCRSKMIFRPKAISCRNEQGKRPQPWALQGNRQAGANGKIIQLVSICLSMSNEKNIIKNLIMNMCF